MRTPRPFQISVRTPLNQIFSAASNVRVLRILADVGTPIAPAELARRAGLGRTSIYPVLDSLESTGIVMYIGTGPQRHVQLRTAHPLASAILALFEAESTRVEDFVSSLRPIAATLEPRPISVWLEFQPPLEGTIDERLVCYIVSDPLAVEGTVRQFIEQIVDVERAADVHVDVRGMTRSELIGHLRIVESDLQNIVLLAGIPPTAVLSPATQERVSVTIHSHDDQDTRARRLGIAIAAKLKQDASLLPMLQKSIATRAKVASRRERHELDEWGRILKTMSSNRLQRFLGEPSEYATRLRQTLPLSEVLTPAERKAILSATSDAEVRAIVTGKKKRRNPHKL